MKDWKMEIYWRMPVFVQEAALALYARRLEKIYYGPGYREQKEFLSGWRKWPMGYVKALVREKLKKIIKTAAMGVPYYREKWKDIDWRSIRTEKDLYKLPCVNKQEIRNNEGALIREGLDIKSLWCEKTSGSTGTSLKIYWPIDMVRTHWAIAEVMIRNAAGVAKEIPRAMLGIRPIVRGGSQSPPFWRFNRTWGQLYLSSFHISKKTAPEYIKALKEYKSQWLTGISSAIAALAQFALELGISPHPLRAVIVSGDTLQPGMRKSIESFFKCKCFDSYGQIENVSMALECAYGKMHIVPLVGVVEILREDGSACAAGELGEIVGTSILNDAMPLVRYRTGDYAAWAPDQHCECGNRYPILSRIEGRTDDYLMTEDNRKIGRISSAFRRSPTIYSAQLVQFHPGHAYLLVKAGHGYKRVHAEAVKDDILDRVGRFRLDIVEVPEIPRTPRGKTSLVVRIKNDSPQKTAYEKLLGHPIK